MDPQNNVLFSRKPDDSEEYLKLVALYR